MTPETLSNPTWLIPLVTGVAFGLLLTRAARGLAPRVGLVDAPDGRRKVHARPVPVVGGVAVFLATLAALLATAAACPDVGRAFAAAPGRTAALLLAAAVITLVGVADDRVNLRARYKLLGQLAAVAVLVGPGGLLIERVSLLGLVVELGPLAVPVTAFWFLACVNALNLIDGMDGLLGTVGVIALGTLAVLAGMTGNVWAAAVAVALAGALVGFLRYNLPPATVYMGDAGSMLVGLVIGAVAVPANLKGPATVALGVPIAVLVLPMLDTTAAILRRKLTGRGLAVADRGHLHHVLQRHGLTARRVLALVAALGLVAAAGALATTALNNDLFALVAAAGVAITLVATRLFGHAEVELVRKRVGAAVRALRGGPAAWELAVRLQGTADWDEFWADLTGCAGRLNLQTVRLDVNAPALHENYHARWDRAGGGPADAPLWRVEIPLYGSGHPIGRLEVAGGRDDEPITDKLLTVAKILETAELRAAEVAAPVARPQPVPVPVLVAAAVPVRSR